MVIIKIIGHLAGADKSAVAAINRALRRLRRRTGDTLVHSLKSIIAPGAGTGNRGVPELTPRDGEPQFVSNPAFSLMDR